MNISKNTLNDLEILRSQDNQKGIIDCFDSGLSKEAREKLKEIFANPVSNLKEINKRQDALKYIIKNIALFQIVFKKNLFSNLNHYLEINIKTADLNNFMEKINFLTTVRKFTINKPLLSNSFFHKIAAV